MKNINKNLWAVVVLLLLFAIIPSNVSAQCFNTAVIPSYMPAGCNNDSRTVGRAVVSVSATVGSLYFGITPTYTTFTPYTYSCDGIPDVSVSWAGNTMWALVVYYTTSLAGGSYVWDLYALPGGHISTGILESPAIGATGTIHIDVNYSGYYEIVWDDIFGVQMSWGIFPTTPSTRTWLRSGSNPDVAVGYFYKSYVCNTSLGLVEWGNGSNPYYSGNGANPRIACDFYGNNTIVVFEGDQLSPATPTINHIYGSLDGNIYYLPTDYTMSCGSITSCPQINNNPVVTFSSSGDIMVVWMYSDSGNPACPPSSIGVRLPIAVQCDNYNLPVTSQYMVVPVLSSTCVYPFPSGCVNTAPFVALSGKCQPNIFYSWGDGSSATDGSKDVPWSSAFLKLENEGADKEFVSGVFPNPNNGNFLIKLASNTGEQLNIQIFNSLGQIVYAKSEVLSSTIFSKGMNFKNYDAGIYLVRVVGTSSVNNWKFILTN